MSVKLSEFVKDFIGIIIGAFIFIVSFLWKDLLSDIQEIYFPPSNGLQGRIIYVMCVTLVILIIVIIMKKIVGYDDNNIIQNLFQFDDTPDSHN